MQRGRSASSRNVTVTFEVTVMCGEKLALFENVGQIANLSDKGIETLPESSEML
jgi:hypothetical protein